MHSVKKAVLASITILLLGSVPITQAAHAVEEAPSTVNATYVEPSATRALKPGEKVGRLFHRNQESPYVLQKINARTFWVQRNYYGTIFYVGDRGVLLFDPLDGAGEQIKQAVASVTDLPITAIVYSHNHNDHIGNAEMFVGDGVEVITSEATAQQQALTNSTHPKATREISWPNGSFRFEGLTVDMHGIENAAHARDHSIWLLKSERIAHLPDLVNPDQPPFWEFAGSESFLFYENNIEQLASLDWDYLSGGHGNIGSKDDIKFYREFLADLKQAVGQALGSTPWGTGVDASKVNAHTAFLPAWLDAVSAKATTTLRPKYGQYYGFEAATPTNAKMVAMWMFDYR